MPREISHSASASASSGAKKPLRVLLVEEERADAILLMETMSRSRRFTFDVETAPDVATAQSALAERRFDLMILDFWLGAEPSLVLLDHPSGLSGGLPAVMISSVDVVDVAGASLGAGARAFLHKRDLSPEKLETVISKALYA